MICKTMKRGVIGAGLGVLALGLLFGTSAPHYVKTAFQRVRSAADSQVPIEFKIDQARQQIAALEPAISENIESLVQAELAVERLEDDIALTEANLEAEGREMLALNEALKDGRLKLASDGIAYSPEEIKADLERRLDHYRTTKESLKHKRETLKARVEHVQAIRKALNEMAAQKKTLEAEIDAIESRLAQIQATQATNEFTFDDTPLAKAKATIAELDKQLEVMTRKAAYEGQYVERGVVIDVEPERDITAEVEEELEEIERELNSESASFRST